MPDGDGDGPKAGHGGGGDGPRALADGHHATRLPPTFAPDAGGITFDADAGCANAFATASVSGGNYLLTHLWPGDYSLRFFDANGAPLPDDPALVSLGAGGHERAAP